MTNNYKETLFPYINKEIKTIDLVNIFATDHVKNKCKNESYRLGGRDIKLLLIKARKFCEITTIKKNSGKYIISEIYDDVNLEKYNNHPLYKTYHGMKDRCYNQNAMAYHNYGGRGIIICDEWLNKKNGIRNFIQWAELNSYIPNKGLTIDRKNNNKGYSPENCRWTTWDIQMSNKRNSRKTLIDGHNIEEYNGFFLANLYFDGKLYPIGTFDNIEDAVESKYNLLNKLEEIHD